MTTLISNLLHQIIADVDHPLPKFITSYESNLEKPMNPRRHLMKSDYEGAFQRCYRAIFGIMCSCLVKSDLMRVLPAGGQVVLSVWLIKNDYTKREEDTVVEDRIESKWIEVFGRVFKLCKVATGDEVLILSESQSRQVNVRIAELALLQLGVNVAHLVLPTPELLTSIPVRSTGSSDVLRGRASIVTALAQSVLVVDMTQEGLLHAPELAKILESGTRVLMISNEHPEALERLSPDESLRSKVTESVRMAKGAEIMTVTSETGTNLKVGLKGCPVAGVWGWTDRPGTIAHWPGGVIVAFPLRNSVNGRLVLGVGDINLTFKRYVESPVTLIIENDYVVSVEGLGIDAILMRQYYEAWNDREAYGVSHVGWGLNDKARYEALMMYDKDDTNGTELRVLAGNFLFSTGANEHANRFTLGHFDLPMLDCTVRLDNETVVERGKLIG